MMKTSMTELGCYFLANVGLAMTSIREGWPIGVTAVAIIFAAIAIGRMVLRKQ